MIKTLHAMLTEQLALIGQIQPAVEHHMLELAAAALLLEVTRSDHAAHPAEQTIVVDAIRKAYALNAPETDALLATAAARVEDAVSLHDFTRVLNARLGAAHKKALVADLWRVAYADGRLDKYEEYTIRKIADLLHVPHRDFIHAKHLARMAHADHG
jgi:uncharacterized tellurite resistance protein B-like protein